MRIGEKDSVAAIGCLLIVGVYIFVIISITMEMTTPLAIYLLFVTGLGIWRAIKKK